MIAVLCATDSNHSQRCIDILPDAATIANVVNSVSKLSLCIVQNLANSYWEIITTANDAGLSWEKSGHACSDVETLNNIPF